MNSESLWTASTNNLKKSDSNRRTKALKLDQYPRIACIGAEALTPSHGTGFALSRHFSKYPASKILDVHCFSTGGSHLFKQVSVPRHDLNYLESGSRHLKSVNECLRGAGPQTNSSIYRNFIFSPVDIDWKDFGGPPDLIYSTCFSALHFAFLQHFYRALPKKVPIVQHFLDLSLRDYEKMAALYFELLPAIASVWALTEPIKGAVAKFSFLEPELVQALHHPISREFKTKHRQFKKNFRALIIGNIWSPSAYRALQEIWEQCQTKLNNLPAITWYGHARRKVEMSRMPDPPLHNDNVIRDKGFVSKDDLHREISGCDIGFVAINGDVDDRKDMSTYSLPSRIGDYCAAGLPIVALSDSGTVAAQLISKHGLGIILDAKDRKGSERKLRHFILDHEWRAECGANSRQFAERELDLEKYQAILYPKLAAFSKMKLRHDILNKRFSVGSLR